MVDDPSQAGGSAGRPSRKGDDQPRQPLIDTLFPQAAAFARRHYRQYARSPLSLVFLVAWPTFWYLLVAHLLFDGTASNAQVVATAKSAFAVSFGLFGAFTVSLTGVVGTFTADIVTKRYRKFRSLPVSPLADFVGRFMAGAGLALVSYIGLLVVGFLDGGAFTLKRPWSPVIVFISVVAFAAIGVALAMALSALVPRPHYATTLATAIILGTFFGTGFNGVSPGLFPGPAWLLNVIPVTLITRVQLRHLVIAGSAASTPFGPPVLPGGPAAIGTIGAYCLAALAAGALVVGHTVYEGEAGE